MATEVKRGAGVAMFVAVLLGTGALGYGVAEATDRLEERPRQSVEVPAKVPVAPPVTKPVEPPPAEPVAKPSPAPKPAPKPMPKPLIQKGDQGPEVRELQARLRQIAWFSGDVTDHYGDQTTEAVRGFQAKREIRVTGYVDRVTLDRLHAMTREPSAAELENRVTPMGNVPGALDARCLTGRAMCVDKSSRTLRWVVDGKVLRTMDVRFGSTVNNTPTREGQFSVGWKDPDHVSSLYDSEMPYSMFFSGGQAVHYSSDFASQGYSGASHGCINVRDYEAVQWLYGQVDVGDKVVVYWS